MMSDDGCLLSLFPPSSCEILTLFFPFQSSSMLTHWMYADESIEIAWELESFVSRL